MSLRFVFSRVCVFLYSLDVWLQGKAELRPDIDRHFVFSGEVGVTIIDRTRLLTNQRDCSYIYAVVSLLAAIFLEGIYN